LSIALIGPDERRRKAVAGALADFRSKTKRDNKGLGRGPGNRGAAGHGERSLPAGGSEQLSVDAAAIREYTSYPESIDDLPRVLQQHYDVIIVDLDSDPEFALYLVEGICAYCPATVMVYSEKADLQLAVRFMRAGAREFLTLPLAPDDIAGALARVSIRRPEPRSDTRNVGNLFVFFGAKGGCGVTTIASNFALALAQESSQSTLLIDFGLPLGDAAINLGMSAEYSTANALQDFNRLDANFLSGLLARHSSGLFVLSAPNEFSSTQASKEAIDRLLAVARQNYDYVVVDAGSRLDLKDSALFDESATIYLITQVGVSELRNANRLISKFFFTRGHNLQVVLNRYIPHSLGLDDKHIAKALTRPAQWTVPDDYATARRTANTANPIVLDDSPISIAIRKMARTACGLPAEKPKKKILGIFS
jgi:pilus assembly protein CpaE